jgi:regulator of chromosome condensation
VFRLGCGDQNQLGRHTISRTRVLVSTPLEFGLLKRKIKDVSCGAFHSFAIDVANRVYAWGLNDLDQNGISTGAGESNAIIETPTVVTSLSA